jgi:uncharacterized protein YyaL (SSP411 family)
VAERALAIVTTLAPRAPRAVGWGLAAEAALVAGPLEIAVVGDLDSEDFADLRRVALMATSPGAVLAMGDGQFEADSVPLLRDRPPVGGSPTAYVCRGFVCDAPTTDPAKLALTVGARAGRATE